MHSTPNNRNNVSKYSTQGKSTTPPKYIKNVAIGGKGGSKINMDVESQYKTSRTSAPVEKVNSQKAPDKNESAQQSVELVAEETETSVKRIVPAEKHVSKSKKHKKGHHTERTPTINLDTEPLVDVIPKVAPGYVSNSGPSKGFVVNKKDNIPCQVKYSGILCSVPQALTNLSLYNFIDDWYGTEYQMGGNDKTGIDCSAFVQRLYLEVFGFSMVRTALEQFNNCTMVWNTEQLKEGDLVFFKIHSKKVTHVGVYLMNNFFVHASASQGVVISSLNDNYWSKYFAGGGQILEDFAPMH